FDLAASTTYRFRLSAFNAAGDSGYSNIADATTFVLSEITVFATYDNLLEQSDADPTAESHVFANNEDGVGCEFDYDLAGAVPIRIDVTNFVRNWASGAWPNYGIFLRENDAFLPPDTALRQTSIYSLEIYPNAGARPHLIITFN